jgi:hypothetical protein
MYDRHTELMQVLNATSNADSNCESRIDRQKRGRKAQQARQRMVAILHDDACLDSGNAHADQLHNVGVVECSEQQQYSVIANQRQQVVLFESAEFSKAQHIQ